MIFVCRRFSKPTLFTKIGEIIRFNESLMIKLLSLNKMIMIREWEQFS